MNQIEEKRSRSAEEADFGGGGRLERVKKRQVAKENIR